MYGFTQSHIACKLKGTYIGPYNIELYVSNYGQSQTENELVHVDSLGQPFLFHTLADIENINAMSGTYYFSTLIFFEKMKMYFSKTIFDRILVNYWFPFSPFLITMIESFSLFPILFALLSTNWYH